MPVYSDPTAIRAIDAEQQAGGFRAAGSEQSGEPDHFTAADRHIDGFDRASAVPVA